MRHVAARVFAWARETEPRLVLRIAGDGPERASLERIAADLELGDSARFLGSLTRSQVVSEMQLAALFAFPSRGDSFGIPVVEALCTGLPVVGTSVGIVPEVLDKARGRVSPVDDETAFREGILDIVGNLDAF